jgi:hypothetical protein
VRRARLHRISAAILASLWIVVPVVAAVHAVVDEHTWCAEHAAFEEGGRAGAAAASDTRGIAASDGPAGCHRDCALGDFVAGDTPSDEPERGVAIAAAGAPAAPPADATGAPPIALLRLAPKSSPPARA